MEISILVVSETFLGSDPPYGQMGLCSNPITHTVKPDTAYIERMVVIRFSEASNYLLNIEYQDVPYSNGLSRWNCVMTILYFEMFLCSVKCISDVAEL